MKYKVLSPIRNNGKNYPINSEITLKEIPEGLKDLLQAIPEKEEAKKSATASKSAAVKKAAPKTKKKIISKK